MKLWQRDGPLISSELAARVEHFTVGQDRKWDLLLARHDVEGSLAHVRMLRSIDLLSAEELLAIEGGMAIILDQVIAGTFGIEDGVEDVHSQVELMLTRMLGDTGKKIHSGRSRNDQSLTDIKLFLKEELRNIARRTANLFDLLITLSERHKDALMPGYTHTQLAMPSSFGLWFGAWAESLSDDLEMMIAAYKIADRNPLGSGAGHGSSFPLDREMTTQLLKFGGMNVNSVYAQMTRGKVEKTAAAALSGIAGTLGRLATDVCLFTNQNMAFLSFSNEITTGSSIMPHKKNPDVFELIRAKCNMVQSVPNQLALLCTNLISGYHRDMQLTKDCLFPAIEQINECLEMTTMALKYVRVNDALLDDPKYDMLFTVEEVNKLVLEGMPFRDAYKCVASAVAEGNFTAGRDADHSHVGSIGNLRNDLIVKDFNQRLVQII